MPSTSKKQQHLMSAVAHGWKVPGGKGPSKAVASEFHQADLTKGDKLKKLYGGGKVSRFDDGGDVDLSEINPTANYMYDNSGPSAADIASLTGAGSGTNAAGGNSGGYGVDALPTGDLSSDSYSPLSAAQLGNTSSGSSSKAGSSSAISALAKALGLSSTSASGLQAIAGILGAAGAYSQNKANSPKFSPPPIFGGQYSAAQGSAAGTTGQPAVSTGFGPAGGYNYKNYQGINSSTPGLGYTPQTASAPVIPNYYTYGQNPQANFQTPVGHKKGGRVSTPQRFDMGGAAAPPMSGAPTPPSVQPPMAGAPPVAQPPMSGPNTHMPMQQPGGPNMQQMPGQMQHLPMMQHPGTPMPMVNRPMPMQRPPMMGAPMRHMAEGGASSEPAGALSSVSRHVKGPGDGTSDSIPARLANGEYVMDAQTVSMAGNGSNEAGAAAFDKMREELRKHKGAALAKGKMAPDAKSLMKYMGGKV